MLTRRWTMMGTLLPGAALLAASSGCSSSSKAPERMTESRQDAVIVTARYETRNTDRSDEINNDRSAQQSHERLTARTDASMNERENRSVRTSVVTTESGAMGAAEQQERVTLVSLQPPPMMRAEFVPRELRDSEFWVAGHWRAESDQYVWQPGRIEQDRSGQLYLAAYWAPNPRGWEYTPESWR